MTRVIAGALLFFFSAMVATQAQNLTNPALSTPAPKKAAKSGEKDPVKAALGGRMGAKPTEPITTEIYSDEAYFDSAKSIGIFTGHVIVKDPRFNVQADKMTIYLAKSSKEEGETKSTGKAAAATAAATSPTEGLEKAIAEGNVGVVRETPGENGAPPSRSIGRADTAIYTTSDGNVELRGNPRVQSGQNTHVATSPDTVMILSQDSKLTTRGPSRTEIRQEPKPGETPKP